MEDSCFHGVFILSSIRHYLVHVAQIPGHGFFFNFFSLMLKTYYKKINESGILRFCCISFIFFLTPYLLCYGAEKLDPYMRLHPIYAEIGGAAFAAAGIFLILWAAQTVLLKRKLSALKSSYLESKFMAMGAYRVIPHPIYWGACMAVVGFSLFHGSSAGLYVMFPLTVFACFAIYIGYEKKYLLAKFGAATHKSLFELPKDADTPFRISDKINQFIISGGIWIFVYYTACASGFNSGAPSSRIFGENPSHIITWSTWIYTSLYVVLPVVFFTVPTNRIARKMLILSFSCCMASILFITLFPFSSTIPDFVPNSFSGKILALEYQLTPTYNIDVPSFRFFGVLLVLWYLFYRKYYRLAVLATLWGIGVAWSSVATGLYSYLGIIASCMIFTLVVCLKPIIKGILGLANRLANSWSEHHFGGLRIINHAIFSFLAASIGMVIALYFAGPTYLWPIFVVGICSLIGATLWGQFIDESPAGLRPFGYFGAVIGGGLGILIITPFVYEELTVWFLLGALTCCAPVVQSIGRLRCLVQGCCHGMPVAPIHQEYGIRYNVDQSYVCKMTGWKNLPLHATPLYSIAFNMVMALIFFRFWRQHMPIGFSMGLYFILTGLWRFIEEAFRGESRRKYYAGLLMYQWLSIGLVLIGFAVWGIPKSMPPAPVSEWSWANLKWCMLLGLIYAFAMSCDFPGSRKRFARLTEGVSPHHPSFLE